MANRQRRILCRGPNRERCRDSDHVRLSAESDPHRDGHLVGGRGAPEPTSRSPTICLNYLRGAVGAGEPDEQFVVAGGLGAQRRCGDPDRSHDRRRRAHPHRYLRDGLLGAAVDDGMSAPIRTSRLPPPSSGPAETGGRRRFARGLVSLNAGRVHRSSLDGAFHLAEHGLRGTDNVGEPVVVATDPRVDLLFDSVGVEVVGDVNRRSPADAVDATDPLLRRGPPLRCRWRRTSGPVRLRSTESQAVAVRGRARESPAGRASSVGGSDHGDAGVTKADAAAERAWSGQRRDGRTWLRRR